LLPRGMSGRLVLQLVLVLVLLAGVTFFLRLDQSLMSNTVVLRSIQSPNSRLPLSAAAAAQKSLQRYSLKDIVAVPLEPYNACGDRILHVSCLKTIIIDGAVDIVSSIVPTVSSLYPQLCEDLVQQTTDDPSSSRKQLDEAHCMLCLQVEGTVSALAQATKMKDEIKRYLLPTEASRVAAAIVPAGGVITHRIVDRKTIQMRQTYLPFSIEHNRQRQYESNFGNLIWQFGATRLINPFTTLFAPARSNWAVSAVVAASANSLFLDELPPWGTNGTVTFTKQIRSWDVPTIMLGIGIQKEFSSNFSAADMQLFDYQRTFLHEIAKRQSRPAIAVRGHLTRIACENAGLTHCMTMGCPSLTINTVANLGATMDQKWKTTLNKLADKERVKLVLALPATPGRYVHRKVMELFAKLAKVHEVVMILQSPKQGELDIAKQLGMMEHTRAVEFDNVEEWFNLTANADLVLSARIHGGMAGIAGGTPSIVIPMDWRIQELVDAMHIPSLPLERINSDMDLGMLLRQADVDFKAFEANRRERILQYIEILGEADLEINPKLLDVVHGDGAGDRERYD
jgi:Polysaccharide pyruvyl transferase